jgi:hypothetical protein
MQHRDAVRTSAIPELRRSLELTLAEKDDPVTAIPDQLKRKPV